MAHAVEDAVLVVDDWLPIDARAEREADRLLRAQGNRAGRGRLRRDATFAPTYAPQRFIVSTGEDVPDGESLRARLVVVHVGACDLDWNVLGSAQHDAARGRYAAALAAFIRWTASRLDLVGRPIGLVERRARLEQRLRRDGSHPRTVRNAADLLASFELFLEFACTVDAMNEAERARLTARAFSALSGIDDDIDDPTLALLELLGQAIDAERCHLTDSSGAKPDDADVWGWRDGEPRGMCIGYLRLMTFCARVRCAEPERRSAVMALRSTTPRAHIRPVPHGPTGPEAGEVDGVQHERPPLFVALEGGCDE